MNYNDYNYNKYKEIKRYKIIERKRHIFLYKSYAISLLFIFLTIFTIIKLWRINKNIPKNISNSKIIHIEKL